MSLDQLPFEVGDFVVSDDNDEIQLGKVTHMTWHTVATDISVKISELEIRTTKLNAWSKVEGKIKAAGPAYPPAPPVEKPAFATPEEAQAWLDQKSDQLDSKGTDWTDEIEQLANGDEKDRTPIFDECGTGDCVCSDCVAIEIKAGRLQHTATNANCKCAQRGCPCMASKNTTTGR